MTSDVIDLAQTALKLGLNLLGAIVILIVGWFLAGWVQRVIVRAMQRRPHADKTIGTVLARVVRWLILGLAIVTVLGRFGVQTTSIVALLGAAGLAVGLALQGTLSNVAAGIMLLALRPFRIGDAVDIAGMAGSVDDIGLFMTRITTFEGVPVHLPNSNVWGTEIKNFSQADKRRFDLVVGIGYGDDIGHALAILRELVTGSEQVLEDPEPTFVVTSLDERSVNLLARFWTQPSDLYDVQWDLIRAVKERFDAEGITIPFPQRDVHIVQGDRALAGPTGTDPASTDPASTDPTSTDPAANDSARTDAAVRESAA